ncbi:MAG: hypothetical protein R2847_02730 [Bacteroidia bacterium]
MQCRVKKFRIKDIDATNPVAVGDEVEFENGLCSAVTTKKLHHHQIRKKLSKQVQSLAANIDHAHIF